MLVAHDQLGWRLFLNPVFCHPERSEGSQVLKMRDYSLRSESHFTAVCRKKQSKTRLSRTGETPVPPAKLNFQNRRTSLQLAAFFTKISRLTAGASGALEATMASGRLKFRIAPGRKGGRLVKPGLGPMRRQFPRDRGIS
jgi:hypothetical protein